MKRDETRGQQETLRATTDGVPGQLRQPPDRRLHLRRLHVTTKQWVRNLLIDWLPAQPYKPYHHIVPSGPHLFSAD